MSLFNLMGLTSTIAMTLPIAALLITRLAWYKCLPALFAYLVLAFFSNALLLSYIPVSTVTTGQLQLLGRMLDGPLMLIFLTYFSQTATFRRIMLITLALYLGFEMAMLTVMGINSRFASFVQAPGIILVLTLSAIFFGHHVKLTMVNQKGLGKLLLSAALVLSYVANGYIFFVVHVMHSPFLQDMYLIFFMVNIFSSLLIAAGVMVEKRRVGQLHELARTREELKAIYGDAEIRTALPFEKAVFKFDKGGNYYSE